MESDNSNLVNLLEAEFLRYVATDPGLPLVLALWSLATHVYDRFDAFPYLAITSPTKRCGKTRAAEVLALFCARVLRTVGITPAGLFRSIEQDKPTLIIDEAESLNTKDDRSSTLREVLNAGYRKGQTVRRCEAKAKGGGYAVKDFETYCPKALVLIGNLPDTLADRTIAIRMRRKVRGEEPARFIAAQAKRDTAQLRSACEQWAYFKGYNIDAIYETTTDLPFLSDREAEMWIPLWVVCQIAAPDRLKDLEEVARRLAETRAMDESEDNGIQLLGDAREILSKHAGDHILTADLIRELISLPEAPWSDYDNGKPVSSRMLAKLLNPFDIRSQNFRGGNRVAKGYTRISFENAFARYLPE